MGDDRASRPFRLVDGPDGVLVVTGELDLSGAAQLRQRLAASPAVAVLDLRDVTFIDAAGLRALEAVPALTLRAPSPTVRRLLHLLGLVDAHMIEGEPQRDAP